MHANPEVIWRSLADPCTYPDWLLGAQEIRHVDADFPAPGSEFHHSVGASDEASVPDTTTAIAADPPRELQLKVRARPFFEGIVTFRLEGSGSTTEVVVHERPVGWLRCLGPLLAPLLTARNARSLDKLKELVESGSPAR